MYSLVLFLVSPLVFFYTLQRALRGDGWRYFFQRLGLGYPQFKKNPLWIHCASVGEVNAAMPLLQAIVNKHPQQPLLISTNTKSGADIFFRHKLDNAKHAYLPLDYSILTHCFLHACKPQVALIMETELWPNLFSSASKIHLPLLIINARLSRKTLTAPGWLKNRYARCLRQTRKILVRSPEDAKGFQKLGAQKKQLRILGNLKYAATNTQKPTHTPLNQTYWLAASTHQPEEMLCAQIQLQTRDKLPLLVIVPRHPQRRNKIIKQLSTLALKLAVRSRGDDPTNADVYLADTFGELSQFMQHAEVCFIGGSLIEHGGQNIIEAARADCAMICGPHMHNFATETQSFLAAGAIQQVKNQHELEKSLHQLINDPALRNEMKTAGQHLLLSNAGILDQYMNRLEPFVKPTGRGS